MKKRIERQTIIFFIIIFVLTIPVFLYAGTNLLSNPDAETGTIQGWTDPDDVWDAASEISPHGGSYFFWPSRGALPNTYIYQDIKVSNYSSDIASGSAYFHISGWLANWDQYPHDRSTLAIEALDSNGNQLLYLSRHHRSPTWAFYKIEENIPATTETLRVYLIATRFVGTDNDGYFDDLTLEVDTTAPNVFVTVTPASGTAEVEEGSTLQLSAASTENADSSYTWSSSFEAVATVDENGLVTAVKAGRATIQATGKTSGAVGALEIAVYSSNDIIFSSPKSGDKWTSGSIQTISWSLKGNIDSGTLYYSTNGGVDWTKIDDLTDLSIGQYAWTLPVVSQIENNCVLKMDWGGGEAQGSIFTIETSSSTTSECKINIKDISVSGTREVGSPVTFTMNVDNSCSGTVYYRYTVHCCYGTSGYDGLQWKSMTSTEYTTENTINYTFDEAGKYIVVIWAKNATTC